MDDDTSYDRPRSPSPANMSKVPSWISVGVVIGVLIGFALQPAPRAPEVRVVEIAKPTPKPVSIPVAEAIFEKYRRYAIWLDDDTTQISVWNADTKQFTDFFEVLRAEDKVYFRSIPAFTRQPIDYGAELPVEAPIRFAGPVAPRSAAQPNSDASSSPP